MGTAQIAEQNSIVVPLPIPRDCSRRKPQPVREWAMNLCLAEDGGADTAGEPDAKTSFAESKTSVRRGNDCSQSWSTLHRLPARCDPHR